MPDSKRSSRDEAREEIPVLDASLRDRVAEAAADFQRCFPATASPPTPGQLDALRDATDRLMRACARVLIALGRRQDEPP